MGPLASGASLGSGPRPSGTSTVTSDWPSAVHSGAVTVVASTVRGDTARDLPVAASATHSCVASSYSAKNAICVPSGDQTGAATRAPAGAVTVTLRPVAHSVTSKPTLLRIVSARSRFAR